MGAFSIWHWLIVLAIALLLFGGGGKIPKLMRDLGEGITAFRKGMKTPKEDDSPDENAKSVEDGSRKGQLEDEPSKRG